jgi:hypothetical protein
MKKGEFIIYLNDIGFSDKLTSLSPYKDIKLEFEEPLSINEGEEVYGLFSSCFSMQVDSGEGATIELDEVSEDYSKQIFEYLESGNWDFK